MRDRTAAHPGQQITLGFMGEARVGRKGRNGHRWWLRGERPRGLCDGRYDGAYVYAAVLATFAQALPAGQHAVLVLDHAGWDGAKALVVPPTIALVLLPPYSPELNPVERV